MANRRNTGRAAAREGGEGPEWVLNSVTHRECSQSPSSSSAKEASSPSPRKLDSLSLAARSFCCIPVFVRKPLLLTRLFQQLVLHQAYGGHFIYTGAHTCTE